MRKVIIVHELEYESKRCLVEVLRKCLRRAGPLLEHAIDYRQPLDIPCDKLETVGLLVQQYGGTVYVEYYATNYQ